MNPLKEWAGVGVIVVTILVAATGATWRVGERVADVWVEVANVRTELSDVRVEVADVRTELADVRTELKTEIAGIGGKLDIIIQALNLQAEPAEP